MVSHLSITREVTSNQQKNNPTMSENWKVRFLVFFGFGVMGLMAQTDSSATGMLGFDAFMAEVKAHHPIVRQADLRVQQAANRRQIAQGGFDPGVSYQRSQKDFDDKSYYDYSEAALKVPVWAGIDLEAAYLLAEGDFLNPQLTVPQNGLYAVGISIPLARNLVMDARRAAVREARAMETLTLYEQNARVNDLLLKAAETYWDWALAHAQLMVFEQALQAADIRFKAVRRSYTTGQLPGVDTLESYIQYQSRLFSRNEAALQFTQAALDLGVFLWSEDGYPLQLATGTQPEISVRDALPKGTQTEDFWRTQVSTHPRLRALEQNRAVLGVQKKLAINNLFPEVNLQYRLLSEPLPWAENALQPNNNMIGLKASVPLFLRRQRGQLKLVNNQLRSNFIEVDFLRIELDNNVRKQFAGVEVAASQVQLSSAVMRNTRALFDAEARKFGMGESSLFLINSRELSAIDAEIQFLRTKNRFLKADARLIWAAGAFVE